MKVAFDGDYELIKYYDSASNVDSIDSMVTDVLIKIKDYPKWFNSCYSYSVSNDEEPIGYLFITKEPNLLVSFSINKNFRDKDNLKSYFDCIVKEFNTDFDCLLFSHNDRAINWLKRCGMVEVKEFYQEGITKLNYKLCP